MPFLAGKRGASILGGPNYPSRLPSAMFALANPGGWWDFSSNDGLFQDAAGTTPVTALGQPVGLALDKSRWGGKTFAQVMAGQPEIWQHSAASVVGESQILGENTYRIFTSDTSNSYVANTAALTLGQFYEVTFNIDSIAVVGEGIRVADNGARFNTTGPKRSIVQAENTTAFIKRNGVACDYQISNVSFKEIPGNHASQSTSGARPLWQADSNGFPGLQFDGVDDFLVTPSIDFSASDKMLVSAGVRKLSDANRGVLLELGDGLLSAGLFRVQAPSSNGLENYQWSSGGSSTRNVTVTQQAPISNVLTGIGDIGGDISRLRVDGAVAGENLDDQGTSNFSNAPLYIGQRGGSSLPFNGFVHQLVVRGGDLPDAATIAQLEAYIAGKSGVTI